VCALLGEQIAGENRGGGHYTYMGMLGEVTLRPGGQLDARMMVNPAWQTQDPQGHAANVMKSLPLDSRFVSSSLQGGSGSVIYCQELDGIPLFSCQVIFVYKEHQLIAISGTLLATQTDEVEEECLTLPTVLLRFLDEVQRSGDVCSEILAVEPGYLAAQSFTASTQLKPVWYISTNTAEYYVDAVSGSVSRIGES